MRFKREQHLEAICLNVIADNISLYIHPNEAMRTHVEFLRRWYSDRLFNLITKKSLAPEKYLEWFISPYWKQISLVGSNYSVSPILKKMQVIGEAVTSLTLSNNFTSVDILSAIICCVPNIRYLDLQRTSCSNSLLLLIRKMCGSLISLNLFQCTDVNDFGMTNLCNTNHNNVGFESLKELNIFKTQVSHKGIVVVLKNLTSLQSLNCENLCNILYYLHKLDLDSNLIRYRLTDFDYQSTAVVLQEILRVWIVMCPCVRTIRIHEDVWPYDMKLCSNFEYLEKVVIKRDSYIQGCDVFSKFLKVKGAMLTEIEITCASVPAGAIVEHCCNLEKLFLHSVIYENYTAPIANHKLKKLKLLSLKFADLKEEPIYESICCLINSGENLNELHMQYIQNFSVNIADIILKLQNLSLVDFSFTDISPPILWLFFTCKTITVIRADGCLKILENDENIIKLINNSQYGNTFSWEIDYSEIDNFSLSDCSAWRCKI